MLAKNEAISLVLFLGKGTINSTVTLQKSVARLLSYLIPLEYEFKLNKYGSDCKEIRDMSSTEWYDLEPYTWKGGTGRKYQITEKGRQLAEEVLQYKVTKLLTVEETELMKEEIEDVASMSADEASKDEHEKLLVDKEDRHKLIYRINNVHIELLDLHEPIKNTEPKTLEEIDLYALIEYAYYLSKFIKEIRFKGIEQTGYDFEADMRDYYYIEYLETKLIPEIKLSLKNPDEKKLSKLYSKLKAFGDEGYKFSLKNPELMKLIQ